MHIGPGSAGSSPRACVLAPLIDPALHLIEVPYDAPGSQVEPLRKFASLLQLVDGRICERHNLPQLRPTDRPAKIPAGRGRGSGRQSLCFFASISILVHLPRRRPNNFRHQAPAIVGREEGSRHSRAVGGHSAQIGGADQAEHHVPTQRSPCQVARSAARS